MNEITLIGNLTRDPEVRSTQSGVAVCNFTIAVNRRRHKGQEGQEEVDFFNVVVWREMGQACGQYLAKGRKVAVRGEMQARSYTAQDGTQRTAWDVIAQEVEFLTPRSAQGEAPAPQGYAQGYQQARQQPARQQTPQRRDARGEAQRMAAQRQYATGPADDFTQADDEELPF